MSNPTQAHLERLFQPVLDDLEQRAGVAGRFIDKDVYRILVSTLWVNLVLEPGDAGLDEADLEPAHHVLNQRISRVLGRGEDLCSCFRFLDSRPGEAAMKAARLTAHHRDVLLYFASIILDPEGHRRWAEAIRQRQPR